MHCPRSLKFHSTWFPQFLGQCPGRIAVSVDRVVSFGQFLTTGRHVWPQNRIGLNNFLLQISNAGYPLGKKFGDKNFTPSFQCGPMSQALFFGAFVLTTGSNCDKLQNMFWSMRVNFQTWGESHTVFVLNVHSLTNQDHSQKWNDLLPMKKNIFTVVRFGAHRTTLLAQGVTRKDLKSRIFTLQTILVVMGIDGWKFSLWTHAWWTQPPARLSSPHSQQKAAREERCSMFCVHKRICWEAKYSYGCWDEKHFVGLFQMCAGKQIIED